MKSYLKMMWTENAPNWKMISPKNSKLWGRPLMNGGLKRFHNNASVKGIGSQKKTMRSKHMIMWNYDLSDWIKRSILILHVSLIQCRKRRKKYKWCWELSSHYLIPQSQMFNKCILFICASNRIYIRWFLENTNINKIRDR